MIRSLFLATLALTAFTSTALAHFDLINPTPDRVDTSGGKGANCGAGTASPTAPVTNYAPGQEIVITVDETTNHPGHYRIALASDENSLPKEPEVTADAKSECGSAMIAPPSANILADGLFDDLTAADPAATVKVKLPDGLTCKNCVLQVIEFMSDHAEPCFYYHCAKVNVSADVPPTPDPGPNPAPDAGPIDSNPNNGGGSAGGCSTTTGGHAGWALLTLAALIALGRRGKFRPAANPR